MKLLGWLIRLAFFGLVLWFALKNTTPVPVRLSATLRWDAVPLIVVILTCLVVGVLAGALALAPRLYRMRRDIARLQAQLKRGGAADAAAERMNDRLAAATRDGGAVGEFDARTR